MLKSVLWLQVDRFDINSLPLELERRETSHALPQSQRFGAAGRLADCFDEEIHRQKRPLCLHPGETNCPTYRKSVTTAFSQTSFVSHLGCVLCKPFMQRTTAHSAIRFQTVKQCLPERVKFGADLHKQTADHNAWEIYQQIQQSPYPTFRLVDLERV
jgi:hypothetical protein